MTKVEKFTKSIRTVADNYMFYDRVIVRSHDFCRAVSLDAHSCFGLNAADADDQGAYDEALDKYFSARKDQAERNIINRG